MDFGAIETTLGVKIAHALAGFFGGAVRGLIVGGGIPATMTAAGIGCFTAAYVTSPVYFLAVNYFPALKDPATEHASAFLVGLCALIICEGAMKYAKKRIENAPPAGPSNAGFTTTPPAYVPPAPKAGE